MTANARVLVVGTTADYIDMLARRFPGRALFVTDPGERGRWPQLVPPPDAEVLVGLLEAGPVVEAVRAHLGRYGWTLSGVVCYDCESLWLGAAVAEAFGLDFSSHEAVVRCRSKHLSKRVWMAAGVGCPRAALAATEAEAVGFFEDLAGGLAVMKPLSGSGGELVFLCASADDCRRSFQLIRKTLAAHPNERMYGGIDMADDEDPRQAVVLEEYIVGDEYSGDFMLEGGRVRALRVSKKIAKRGEVFGTIMAYEVPAVLPEGWTLERIEGHVCQAALSLGLTRCIMMADFKFVGEGIVFFEMTPRLGGDCLPPLIQASSGFDVFAASFDFAEGRTVVPVDPRRWQRLVGMRIFAQQEGILRSIDASEALADDRVRSWQPYRLPGERIQLPPKDYDSRVLGYVIFSPLSDRVLEGQCCEIMQKVQVAIEFKNEPAKLLQ